MNSGCSLICSISLGAYLLMRKKYASSLAGFTSRPQSGHLPSTSWDSVKKDSQGRAVQSLVISLIDIALVVQAS